jgi:hypothetical protein
MCEDVNKITGRLKRLPGESFLKYQLRQGWCAFMNDAMALESQGALIATGMGIWLMFAHMFESCPQTYWVMKSVMPEKAWATVFIIIGISQAVALMFNVYRWRKRLLLVKTALWVFLFCTVLYGDWRAPGVPIYTIMAIGATRSFFCLRKTAPPSGT